MLSCHLWQTMIWSWILDMIASAVLNDVGAIPGHQYLSVKTCRVEAVRGGQWLHRGSRHSIEGYRNIFYWCCYLLLLQSSLIKSYLLYVWTQLVHPKSTRLDLNRCDLNLSPRRCYVCCLIAHTPLAFVVSRATVGHRIPPLEPWDMRAPDKSFGRIRKLELIDEIE